MSTTSDPAKIRVAIRVRPLLETELRSGLINSKIETTANEVQIKEERGKKAFKYANYQLGLITCFQIVPASNSCIGNVKLTS